MKYREPCKPLIGVVKTINGRIIGKHHFVTQPEKAKRRECVYLILAAESSANRLKALKPAYYAANNYNPANASAKQPATISGVMSAYREFSRGNVYTMINKSILKANV